MIVYHCKTNEGRQIDRLLQNVCEFSYCTTCRKKYARKNSKIIDNAVIAEEKDAIKKDVRAPIIELTFDLQTDVHANSTDAA